jgi:N-acetyl-anhydromuramyl-L-alanine amidase AmpD
MVRDEEVAGHASNENGHNQSHWGSQTSLSFRSIGIENVGTVKQDFEPAQYQSLIRLIHDLMAAHGIKRHRVVAHSDILTDGQHHMSAERIACPGFRFNWEMLETSKPPIGLARTGGNGHSANGNGNGGGRDLIDTFYLGPSIGKDLGIDTLITLKLGDWDPQLVGGKVKAPRWGGKEYKNITDVNISPIKQLQTYLADIGYSVGPATGQFNARTAHAVKHFQVHFEQRDSNDRINFRTASLIRDVWAANPKAD